MNPISSQNILISVITTTYNRLNFLKDCVESVQASVIAPLNFEFEHIVCFIKVMEKHSELVKYLAK